MRNFLESPELFEAKASLDFCYYELERLNVPNKKLRSGLEIMIDIATGFQDSKDLEKIKSALYYLRYAVKYQKILEIDSTKTMETISKLIALRKELKKKIGIGDRGSKFKKINSPQPD